MIKRDRIFFFRITAKIILLAFEMKKEEGRGGGGVGGLRESPNPHRLCSYANYGNKIK